MIAENALHELHNSQLDRDKHAVYRMNSSPLLFIFLNMTTPEKSNFAPPEADNSDLIHALVKASMNAIPVVGAPAADMFALLVTPSLEKRRMEWMTRVGEALISLSQEKGHDFKALAADEGFVDAVVHVTQSALRTSQLEKLDILRNVILNRAFNVAPDITTQHILLELVDSLTALHIRILNYFRAGEIELHWKRPEGSDSPTYRFFEHFDELKGNVIGERIWQDLNTEGLISHGATSLGDGLLKAKASDLGLLLLDLIAEAPGAKVD